ncbi:Calx-beta domain-containing protein [Cyanobacterium aponinum AL20118]|uniref:FG-GAP-like repeat-containing protein n=1 Tax=Cyanobacterium aponinum AL20115 TaxID=3090662 RepID=A0AAF1C5R0_9CHRO|nr:Calx-beta domain-containing protein [Cyanobacterium aponinum]WPF87624.1 FG-GAP-like repeat-containing protein [Cyanobacterium aponinum AL20115]
MVVNLASGLSAITSSSNSQTHLVWAENSFLWYAKYDENSETWREARAITKLENQDISNIQLLYEDNLIQEGNTEAKQPGFVVTWQQGSDNDSDFYYTAGKYDEQGELQWLANPQAITSDQVGDLEPTSIIYQGDVFLVGSKVDFLNQANQAIKEDTDLYFQRFTINDSLFYDGDVTPPLASYSPQLIQQGVITNLIPVNNTPQTVNTFNSNAGQGIGAQSDSSESESEAVVPEYSFAWGGGLEFSVDLLEVLKAKDNVPKGIVSKILTPFIKGVEIEVSLKGGQNSSSNTIIGSSGDNLNPYLSVEAKTTFEGKEVKKIATLVAAPEVEGEELVEESAQKEVSEATGNKGENENEGEEKEGSALSVSLGIESEWSFDRETLLLNEIFDSITLTFEVDFPLVKVPLVEVSAFGDIGASFYVQAEPLPDGDYQPPLSAILEVLGGEILGAGVASLVGAVGNAIATNSDESTVEGAIVWALAEAVFSTVADAITIANDSDQLAYQTAIGVPIVEGGIKFQFGTKNLNFNGSAGVEVGLVWGIGDTPNVQFLLFPIDAGIKIGPIVFGISLRPGWTWGTGEDTAESTGVSSEEIDSTGAQVQGSLLTIDWGENLDPDFVPDGSQFVVTVTDQFGNITTIPVFQVLIDGSILQLRLTEIIPLYANYDYATGDNPQPQPNLIQVSYSTSDDSSLNLQDTQGEVIDSFSLTVANNTPNQFSAFYSPITGNSQNYSRFNNELILYFDTTSFDINVIPDVHRFTVTGANVESVSISDNTVILKLDNIPSNNAVVNYSNQSGQGNLLLTADENQIASFKVSGNGQISQITPILAVSFADELESNFVPNTNQFTLEILDDNGNVTETININQVDLVNGNTVNLYLAQEIESSQVYRLSYTPVTNPRTDLRTQDGTEIASFTVVSNQSNSQGITTNQLTALQIVDPYTIDILDNNANNYTVTLTSEIGNPENTINIQSIKTNSQGVELVVNHNLGNDENITVVYNNENQTLDFSSLVNAVNPPVISNQSIIDNIEADLGEDSTPTLTFAKTGQILMAWVAQTPPLSPIAGFVNGDIITLNFIENLQVDSIPNISQFTVTDTQGNTYTLDGNPSILGNTVTFILEETIPETTELSISYSLFAGNNNTNLYLTDATNTKLWIHEFNDFSLTNTTNSQSNPIIIGAGAIISNVDDQNMNRITLVFDQNLRGNPLENQFTITNNGIEYSLFNEPTVNGNSVTLNVIPPTEDNNLIGMGDLVTVNYRNSINGNPVSPQQQLTGDNGIVADFQNFPVITAPSQPTTVVKYGFAPSGDTLLSTASSIIGSDGINFNPVASLDQRGNNVVAWVHADMSDVTTNLTPGEFYSDDQTQIINESLNQSDIYYSIYNAQTQQWSIASPIISQTGSEGEIVLGLGENKQLIATWLNYTDDETNIYWSSLSYDDQDNPLWSEPSLLYENASPDPLTELEIANINGKTAIFWTQTQQVSYSELTLRGQPALYLRLDEFSGTTANNRGTWGVGGNGVYNNTVNFREVGALENLSNNTGDKNTAVMFNNGSSLTLAEDLSFLSGNSFSAELWFKITDNPSNSLNIASMAGLFNLNLNTASQLSLNINNQTLTGDDAITINSWNYVVITYDGQNKKVNLYLNGQPTVNSDNINLTFPDSSNLTLAGGEDTLYLDEFAFYNSVLNYSDFTANDVNSSNLTSLTGEQLINVISSDGTDIKSKYSAQYIAPLPPGTNTYYAFIDSENDPNSAQQIIPSYQVKATQLADSNKSTWDIVSSVSANSNGYVYPNGRADIYIPLNLENQQTNTTINEITVTAQDSNGNTITWSVNNSESNQLGVVQNNKLLNPINPDGSFSYIILNPNVSLDLFLDSGNIESSNLSNFQYSINGSTPQSINTGSIDSEPTTVDSNQVLGIATVTEANDSSLDLIDSGFIINTDNPAMGYILSQGDLNGDNKIDVIVGNRGYTDNDGNLINNGTIQILFGGDNVLNNAESNPLTATDLSGNPNGILITGIADRGDAKSDYPMSLVTGDIDGDGIEDLVIGAPNVNNGDGIVYVIRGSYIADNQGQIININSDNSFSDQKNTASNNIGFVFNPTVTGAYFGYAVAVGNFDGNGSLDLAIGSPGANNGDGLVSMVYNNNELQTFATGSNGENLGYSLTVSQTNGKQSFSGSTTIDDLIVGAPSYASSVSNQWVGVDQLPSENQNLFPSTTSAAVGKVYVFGNNQTTPLYYFTGSILPSTNGTAENSFTGSAIASDDWNLDGARDLAISAPGSDNSDGLVYVVKGGKPTSGDLDSISNLIILGGLPFSKTGSEIASAGDVNGDGYEDFLVGAPQGLMGVGQSYLLFGPLDLDSQGTLFNLNVTATDSKKTFLLNGSQPYQLTASALSGIGDVNNDNVDDLMITAPNAQQLYAVFGHQWLADDGSIKLADISADNGFVIDGDLYKANSKSLNGNGNNVLILGDINGDGFADVLSGGSEDGAVIIFGSSTENLLDASVGSNDLILSVANHSIQDFASLGDYNGDGLQDFGVIDDDNNFYIQLGSNNLNSLGNLSLSNPSVTSIIEAIELGDYNGDGYDDILLNTSSNSRIYLGNEEGNVNNFLTFNPVGGNSFSDYTFGSIGDIDGDGYQDIATGLPQSNFTIQDGANGQFTIYTNRGNQSILPPVTPSLSNFPSNDYNPTIASYGVPSQQSPVPPNFAVYQGYLYMTFKGNGNDDINVMRSRDGNTWENQVVLTSLQTPYSPSLVVFEDKLYLIHTFEDSTIYITPFTGDDNSISFGEYTALIADAGTSPTPIVFNNKLYIFYIADGDDQINYITLSDPANVTEFGYDEFNYINGQQSFDRVGATLTPDGEKLVLAYKNSNKADIYITNFDGSNWSEGKIVQDSQNNNNTIETTDGVSLTTVGNNIYLAYEGTKPNDLRYIYSQDSGNSWENDRNTPNQLVNGGASLTFFQSSLYFGYSSQVTSNAPLYVSYSEPIYNTNQTQQLGEQLYSIGDFNGDGIEDFAIVAQGYIADLGIIDLSAGLQIRNNQGAILIYYGNANGISNSAKPDVVLVNPPVTDNQSLLYEINRFTAIGDINGDGYDDVAVSSPTTKSNEGSIFVVFGGSSWQSTYSATNPFDLSSLSNNQSNSTTDNSNTNGFLITGLPASQAGISLSGGEDVNGDGFDDFTVGAPGNDDDLTYVIFGSDFTQQVNQTGTIGCDRMIGTPTGEIFIAGEGNDRIYSNGGVDVVYASVGNDFVTVNDTYFRRLDGGTGIDTLKFTGYNGQNWDLTTLSPGNRLRNFEILDIKDYGENTLTLNSLTVTQLSSNNTITVLMDKEDTLNLSADFVNEGIINRNGETYQKYRIDGATVLILEDIVQTKAFTPLSLSLYNTGVDDSGTPLNNNSTGDPHYELVSAPDGSSSNILVTNSGDGISGWISPDNNNSDSSPPGDYTYRTTFNLPDTVNLSQFFIDGEWHTDDEGITITLNGIEQYLASNPNFNTDFVPFTINEGFIAGENILEFTVNNAGTEINPTVLRVKFDNAFDSNIQFSAPSTNIPQAILNPENVSQVSSANNSVVSIDESNNITEVSSSLFANTSNNEDSTTNLYVTNPTVNEADGEVKFTIQRTGNLDKYVQIHYVTRDGRGKAGNDYHPTVGKAIFTPGESSINVSVPLILDDVYTGTKDIGLLVTLEKESHTPLIDEFNIHADFNNGIINSWHHIQEESTHPLSLINGELEFRVTATEGEAEVKLYFDGNHEFNRYYIFNTQNQRYEVFDFNGDTGAELFDEDDDSNYEGVILHLQDGSEHDLDGARNGVILKRGFFAGGNPPETVLNKPMYRFRNSDYDTGAYLYAGEIESESIRKNYPNFVEEGFAFYVSTTPQDGLITFNRFQNLDYPGSYLYAGETESESIRENYPNFVEEGIAFYAYPQGSQMADVISRFQNNDLLGSYLYTSEPETDNVISNYVNFNLEGIAFEAVVA